MSLPQFKTQVRLSVWLSVTPRTDSPSSQRLTTNHLTITAASNVKKRTLGAFPPCALNAMTCPHSSAPTLSPRAPARPADVCLDWCAALRQRTETARTCWTDGGIQALGSCLVSDPSCAGREGFATAESQHSDGRVMETPWTD
ncbi:hypothetical protein VE03_04203 [Pseudogymnoascus sp. 23342-1-I1]|nr:hypothetical protein VE03_04203 [Pseudogymnoascus sp. 23342-1-I1]